MFHNFTIDVAPSKFSIFNIFQTSTFFFFITKTTWNKKAEWVWVFISIQTHIHTHSLFVGRRAFHCGNLRIFPFFFRSNCGGQLLVVLVFIASISASPSIVLFFFFFFSLCLAIFFLPSQFNGDFCRLNLPFAQQKRWLKETRRSSLTTARLLLILRWRNLKLLIFHSAKMNSEWLRSLARWKSQPRSKQKSFFFSVVLFNYI